MADATRLKKQKRTTMRYVSQEFSWGRVKGSKEADFVKAHKENKEDVIPQQFCIISTPFEILIFRKV